jgi:hypothetical protein
VTVRPIVGRIARADATYSDDGSRVYVSTVVNTNDPDSVGSYPSYQTIVTEVAVDQRRISILKSLVLDGNSSEPVQPSPDGTAPSW